ncbi:MAG: hypothetical protein ACOX0D_04240 [Sphaerochaeta sp.]|jgi:hypothetical protein
MKKIGALLLIGLFSTGVLFAALDFTTVDALYDSEQYSACKAGLLSMRSQAATAQEEADVLWRLSRVTLGMGDDLDKKDKDGRFAAYEEGEEYANLSIARYPNAYAYHWKASNIGRWGQTKGPLNALGKAKGMLEDLTMVVNDFNIVDYTETWYVLSSLYNELPGPPLSFGNNNWAISYMRRAMDTLPVHKLYPGHYKKLAEELWARNWSASKRGKELAKMKTSWDKGGSTLERYRFYEGKDGGKSKPFYSSVTLDQMSDRQEAEMVLAYLEAKAKTFTPVLPSELRTLNEISELRASWLK